jgi:proteasome lid subunit RPN8/RPN11
MPAFATRTLDTYQLQEIVGYPDTQAAPIILVSRQALEEMQEIARADIQVEQGGTLIGNIYERGDGPGYLIEITNHIYAKDAQGTHTQLRYTVESWLQRKALMVEQFADKRIVGWYHTHPLHQLSAYKEEPYYHHDALFFSQDDIFIHSQFFQESWYVALVLNTLGQPAFFCWTDNTIVKAAGFFII